MKKLEKILKENIDGEEWYSTVIDDLPKGFKLYKARIKVDANFDANQLILNKLNEIIDTLNNN